MDNYAYLFLQSALAKGNPEDFLSLLLLGLARILPIIGMSPFFGARLLPHPVKVTFGISLFVIFLPVMLANITTPVSFSLWMILLVLKEIFIGFALGFIMSTPFTIVQSVGIIIDHQRGGASLMVNDPTIQNQSSPIGTMLNFVLIYIFFLMDGPFLFMEAISNSYEVLPPDRLLSPSFFAEENTFWRIQIELFNKVMVISTQLAAPALIAILMTDCFLGIANRLAPQVQITFLGMPLKSLLAILVMCLGWKAYNKQTVVEVYNWLGFLSESIQALRPL